MADFEGVSTKAYNGLNIIGQYLNGSDVVLNATADFCTDNTIPGAPTSCVPTATKVSSLKFDLSTLVLHLEMRGVAKTGLDVGVSWKKVGIDTTGTLSTFGGVFTPASAAGVVTKVDDTVLLFSTAYNFGTKYKVGYEVYRYWR